MASANRPKTRKASEISDDLNNFEQLHPKFASMVAGGGKKGKGELDFYAAFLQEADSVMGKFGLKKLPQQTPMRVMAAATANDGSRVCAGTALGLGQGGGGGGREGVQGVVSMLGCKYWAKPDDIIEAAERIKAARMHNPSDPCLEEISLSLFGSPSADGKTQGKDAVMVRARHTTFTDEADFVRAVGSLENSRMRKGRAKLAVAQDDEMGACLSPYRRPVSVRLPPTVPPPRPGNRTQAAGVVEQYEEFIVVDGVCFSPICEWGHAKRPPGISSDTVSNRCIQYFVVRQLNSDVSPEEIPISCTKMLNVGKTWKSKNYNKKNEMVGHSFWPAKAAGVYESLHTSSI
jgi:hypothetical protein